MRNLFSYNEVINLSTVKTVFKTFFYCPSKDSIVNKLLSFLESIFSALTSRK